MSDIILMNDGCYQMKGAVNFDSVNELTKKFLACIDNRQDQEVTVDLSQIHQADSAALAMFIEWIRQMKKRRVVLRLVHPTATLLALARIVHLDDIFVI